MKFINSKDISLDLKDLIEKILIMLGVFLIIYLRILWMDNHYYINGAPVWDTGWFAHLISNPSLNLSNPKVIGFASSYYDTHFSPILSIYAFLSPFKFLEDSTQFAIFIGICKVSCFPLIYFSIKKNFKLKNKYKSLTCLYGFAFLFTVVTEPDRLVKFPHFEVAIPCLIACSLFFLVRKSYFFLVLSLVIALGFREDAGFHIGLIYLLLFFYCSYQNRLSIENKQKYKGYKNITFRIFSLCFLYSILTIFIQKFYFTNDNAFSRIYSGEPFYSHLNLDFIINRFGQLFNLQFYNGFWLVTPIIIYIIAYICTKNIFFLIGFISCLPWFCINLIAVSQIAGSFGAHYGFPFLTGILTPFVLINSDIDNHHIDSKNQYLIFSLFFSSTLILILNFNYINRYFSKVPELHKIGTSEAIKKLSSNSKLLKEKNILLSNPVVSFIPDVFEHRDVAIYKKLNIEEINGIIYMKGSYEEKQILDYLKQIFNDYSLKTKECSINQESNIHGVFRQEYFKELNFLCEE